MGKDTFYSVLTQMKYCETGPRLRLYPTWVGAEACRWQGSRSCYCLKLQNKTVGVSVSHDNKILFVQTQNVTVVESLVLFFVGQFINAYWCAAEAADGCNKSLRTCEHIALTLWRSLQKSSQTAQDTFSSPSVSGSTGQLVYAESAQPLQWWSSDWKIKRSNFWTLDGSCCSFRAWKHVNGNLMSMLLST